MLLLVNLLIQKNKSLIFFFFFNRVLEEKTLTISRTLLQVFAKSLKQLPADIHKEVALFALEKIQPRAVAFEEQISVIRLNLAEVYEEEEDWRESANTLIKIPLEGSGRFFFS